MRVPSEESGGSKKKRVARASRQLELGWFPHDFVEEYVPGRQTEQLIKGGMNLQEAAVHSGAVEKDVALAALEKLRVDDDEDYESIEDSASHSVVAAPAAVAAADEKANAVDEKANAVDEKANEAVAVDEKANEAEAHAADDALAREAAAVEEMSTPRADDTVVTPSGAPTESVAKPPEEAPVPSPENSSWIQDG